MLRWWVRLSA